MFPLDTKYFLFILLFSSVFCHLPEYASTPSSKVDQYCSLADACIHDTIPVCGKKENEMRTFLDFCDLLEYACDTTDIYLHVDDMPGCPELKTT